MPARLHRDRRSASCAFRQYGGDDMAHAYDRIGVDYAQKRCSDPRIAAPILAALRGADSVVNIGAGAGSYEPGDRAVVAVEPAITMLRQRRPGAAPAVRARAEAL